MEVQLTSAQETMRDASVALIERASPLPRVRALAEVGDELGAEHRAGSVELGWLGLDVATAAVVAEVRGATLQPDPNVAGYVVASTLASAGTTAQRDEVLAELLAGGSIATWAAADALGAWRPAADARIVDSGDGLVLDGVKGLVHDAHRADWLLVTAADGDGLTQVLVPATAPGLTVVPLDGLDLTRVLCEVRFDGVALTDDSVVGARGEAAAQVERQLQLAVALSVSETVGAMGRLFSMALGYAKERVAFGRPIGSFQAIKHLLADASLRLETSTAVATAAIRAVHGGHDDAGDVVSMAKAYVAEASVELAHACWQTFGGVAYTWEHDFHLYLRRLAADAALYGDAAFHHERLCAANGL